MTGRLILDVTDDELELLRAVRRDGQPGDAAEATIDRALDRGLIDRVVGSYPSYALATPGHHTLWKHDRPRGVHFEPWERCDACGSDDLLVIRSHGVPWPTRVDCLTCGARWVPPA